MVAARGARGGTDGSDHAYRQIVEGRYARLADSKARLRTLSAVQAAQVSAEALLSLGVPAAAGGTPAPAAIMAVLLGALALALVYMGLPKTSRPMLRWYAILSTGLAIGTLSRVVVARNTSFTAATGFAKAVAPLGLPQTPAFVIGQCLEGVVDMTGTLCGAMCAYMAHRILDDAGPAKGKRNDECSTSPWVLPSQKPPLYSPIQKPPHALDDALFYAKKAALPPTSLAC
eukprot:CAMPEP_0119170668 /NCGR_PEP_ID=MMETSP1315-20130426/20185_1 /TAXON_ID=676789 /ORGANISM="Prasinoderma singularis, Strain RCC927" /LENGTH=229 /DNA_ID=CAMNT_0007164431 /DNA_START=91 /DNA_END=778 /DNA_ORIENTATION=+